MRVLLTNIILNGRTGTECVTRDISLGLAARGHSVGVYSPSIGEMGEEIRAGGVRVTDDLRSIDAPPDIIHGHHNVTTLEALHRFPSSPAIWFCHDAMAWHDEPPLTPQIVRYFAVDEACRDRLLAMRGMDASKVGILHNAVDLNRIVERQSPLPERLMSALAYTKTSGQIRLVEQACAQSGIALSTLGSGGGRIVARPEKELAGYDIVFATARMAIEALASGASVIVVDERGFAGLVTSTNYERLRALNFGRRALTPDFDVRHLAEAIRKYDPVDAQLVSKRLRTDADLTQNLDALERIYGEISGSFDGARRCSKETQTSVLQLLRYLGNEISAQQRKQLVLKGRLRASVLVVESLNKSRLLRAGRFVRRALSFAGISRKRS